VKLTDREDSLRERVVAYGPPKSGKTELAARLAEEFNLHYFDLENGYKPMRKLPQAWQDRINLYSIPDSKVFPIAIETMLKIVPGTSVTFCIKHGKVACMLCRKDELPTESVELNALGENDIVVFDSGTQLALSCMNHIRKDIDELSPVTWDHFRSQGFLMDRFLSQCQVAKYNLLFLTHEVEAEMEDGKKRLVPVAGSANFSRNTAKYFDHVVYCQLLNKEHRFGSATTYATGVLTGSRSDIAIESLKAPSLLPFFRHEVTRQTTAPGVTISPGEQAVSNMTEKLNKLREEREAKKTG
jgi:hypothetical protein